MYMVITSVLLAVFGAIFGSFAGAQVWRLRARQLAEDKKDGLAVDEKEWKRLLPLTQNTVKTDYSRCLHCGHRLGWYDLLPIASWFSTGGRCRYCHARIGVFELLMELGVASVFVASYLLWPWALTGGLDWLLFGIWLASLVVLAIMAGYDAKWKLLPDIANYAYLGIGILFIVVRFIAHGDVALPNVLGALAILSGVYAILYVVSKGGWIGFGDVKLGAGLALFLGDWKLAFLALFLANLLGCIIVLPGILRRQLGSGSQIAFGPLLMTGMLLSFAYGTGIISWFMELRLF